LEIFIVLPKGSFAKAGEEELSRRMGLESNDNDSGTIMDPESSYIKQKLPAALLDLTSKLN